MRSRKISGTSGSIVLAVALSMFALSAGLWAQQPCDYTSAGCSLFQSDIHGGHMSYDGYCRTGVSACWDCEYTCPISPGPVQCALDDIGGIRCIEIL